jgi:hypothetical protein
VPEAQVVADVLISEMLIKQVVDRRVRARIAVLVDLVEQAHPRLLRQTPRIGDRPGSP